MNRKDLLLSKLANAAIEVDEANEAYNAASKRLDIALEVESKIREELEGLNIVQIVYLTKPGGDGWQDSPLKSRNSFDYIDSTFEGLRVGDIVTAPTVYNKRTRGIVVQVGGPRTYWGQLRKITEVLYP